MPCGGRGFSGGVPGCWMCWEGNCCRPGFSGSVPGSRMSGESGMRPGGFGGAGGAGEVGFGARGAVGSGCGRGFSQSRPSFANKPFNSVTVIEQQGAYLGMFGASDFAAYSQSQTQAAQAEGYALGQQDAAYAFYGTHDPFTAAPQHEDPCFSTQDQGAPPPSSEENEFAMFA
eukprot:371432-Rhodomonas_salina.1